jgi:basic membrane protein A
LAVLSVLAIVALAGCTKKTAQGGAAASASAQQKTIALITDVGGVNDQSFNQSAWDGLLRINKEAGYNAGSYIESKNEGDYAPNIETYVDRKPALIWGVGFMMGDSIEKAGKDYPTQQFAIIDYAYGPEQVPNKNVTGVVFAAQECSYLVGYIAGKVSKTGKVGHVNGIGSPTMEAFAVGYYAGVLAANPNAQIMGQYSGSFGDPAAGKNIANQYFADGADIIYAAAGGTGNGVIEAAREQNKWAIGVDIDQNFLAPANVLTSAMKRVDNAVYDLSKKVMDGTFTGSAQTLVYDLKNDGVGYATTGNHIPPAVIEEVELIKADIIAGRVTVPANAAEINEQHPGKFDMRY